jgi:catechol 2,3-dioxygenase-like lactoylglutathione lyase family enzyme
MRSQRKSRFKPGRNIAMKIPPHEFERTVAFYRDILGLRQLKRQGPSLAFEFGGKTLWLDKVDALSQAELWLEVVADDVQAASAYFAAQGIARRDEIETLPEGFNGFWIANPAGIIHLVAGGRTFGPEQASPEKKRTAGVRRKPQRSGEEYT